VKNEVGVIGGGDGYNWWFQELLLEPTHVTYTLHFIPLC